MMPKWRVLTSLSSTLSHWTLTAAHQRPQLFLPTSTAYSPAIMPHGTSCSLAMLIVTCLVACAMAVGIAPNATLAPNTTTPEVTTTAESEPIKPTIQTRGETITVTAARVFAVEADDITFTNAKQPHAQEYGEETIVDISILR